MNSRELESDSPSSPLAVENLAEELVGFTIASLQGQVIGKVERVFRDRNDPHRLNFVISRGGAWSGSPWVWLPGELVKKTDRAARSLYVSLSPVELEKLPPYESQSQTPTGETRVLEEDNISLLEEKLVVKRTRRKIGEVVIRKEIETRMVQVPVRREKLIVEQIGGETQRLAEIDLGEEEVTGVEDRTAASTDTPSILKMEFASPRAASEALEAIALHQPHGCQTVRVAILLDNSEFQQKYQALCDRLARESEVR